MHGIYNIDQADTLQCSRKEITPSFAALQENKNLHRDRQRIDRHLYHSEGCLDLAPICACPCPREECVRKAGANCIPRYIDKSKHPCITQSYYSRLCREQVHAKVNVKYSEEEARLQTFCCGKKCREPMYFVKELVAAGLFLTDSVEHPELNCFRCFFNFKMLDIRCDPFREHARWSPCCPFVIEKKGVDYIHHVLQETEMIKDDIEGRSNNLDNSMLTDAALDLYKKEDIIRAVESFFARTGGFPKDIGVLLKEINNILR